MVQVKHLFTLLFLLHVASTAFAQVLANVNFNSGTAAQEGLLTSGSATLSNVQTRNASAFALRCNIAQGGSCVHRIGQGTTPGTQTAFNQSGTLYASGWIYLTAAPNATQATLEILSGRNNNGTRFFSVRVDNNRNLRFYDGGSTLRATGATQIPLNTWTEIQVATSQGTSAAYEVRIGRTTEFSGTGAANIASNWVNLVMGSVLTTTNGAHDYYWDDVILRTDTWPNQTPEVETPTPTPLPTNTPTPLPTNTPTPLPTNTPTPLPVSGGSRSMLMGMGG